MPGFVMHIAIGQEYLKKHNNIENSERFLKGNIAPDLTKDKSKTHYGKSPTFTNLGEFLKYNEIDNDFNRGQFLHLIADYLFYNYYLKELPRENSKEILHNDYDIINKQIIEKYDVELLDEAKPNVFYKEGIPKILTIDLAIKVIEEISNLKLEEVKVEVLQGDKKWQTYKQI